MGSDTPSQPQQQQSKPRQGSGDLLTTLLGGLVGGQITQQPQQRQLEPQQSQGGGDLVTTRLVGLMGGSGSSSQQSQPSPECYPHKILINT